MLTVVINFTNKSIFIKKMCGATKKLTVNGEFESLFRKIFFHEPAKTFLFYLYVCNQAKKKKMRHTFKFIISFLKVPWQIKVMHVNFLFGCLKNIV